MSLNIVPFFFGLTFLLHFFFAMGVLSAARASRTGRSGDVGAAGGLGANDPPVGHVRRAALLADPPFQPPPGPPGIAVRCRPASPFHTLLPGVHLLSSTAGMPYGSGVDSPSHAGNQGRPARLPEDYETPIRRAVLASP